MYSFRYGGKNGKRHSLTTSNDHVVVRTNSRSALAAARPFEVSALSEDAREVLNNFELTTRFREAGVEWKKLYAILDDRQVEIVKDFLRDNLGRLLSQAIPEPI